MSNPLVRILVKALRDAGNQNGEPIPRYYHIERRLEAHEERTNKVAEIIQAALKQLPPGLED